MKRKAVICFAAVLCLGSGMTAYAAPETMPDGTVFDSAYYAEKNPDVAAVVGTDTNALYQHYKSYGAGEGREAYDTAAIETSNVEQV